jgi:hypothetical protein
MATSAIVFFFNQCGLSNNTFLSISLYYFYHECTGTWMRYSVGPSIRFHDDFCTSVSKNQTSFFWRSIDYVVGRCDTSYHINFRVHLLLIVSYSQRQRTCLENDTKIWIVSPVYSTCLSKSLVYPKFKRSNMLNLYIEQ